VYIAFDFIPLNCRITQNITYLNLFRLAQSFRDHFRKSNVKVSWYTRQIRLD